MRETLARFTCESLFDATVALLDKLHIQINCETAIPLPFEELYSGTIPAYLANALQCISETYFVGIVNDQSLSGLPDEDNLETTEAMALRGDRYDGMFVFACEAKPGAPMTRTIASQLTRAFNRIASSNPVILLIRQGDLLSLASCERTDYIQNWRQSGGEKLGKVSLLRNINCQNAHRGHVDILDSLGDKKYPTFNELYKHWLEVFSNELLTKKFYNELSDWYAWAVMVAKFPNDLRTNEDDAKFNHESCIRLITRLIFVWFLKEKKLIPEEFFDEKYIRENLIEEFDPHARKSLLYDAEKSKYYRLVLQNLFFAMLNCPITAEGKDKANNRRFRKPVTGRLNGDYNVNNLMRYENDFKEDGARKFVKLANSSVPFLNGGLFDCLDDKPRKMYYDGFSERPESLEQLYLPDYLFFGEEVGRGIDLSQWYDDKKKKCVSARGLIDILKKYSFTIEENTPLDQEVSLDPELLGKVFENLLASYNPETQTSARKQTGSFYTPREIVQYMVDESLVAHLKRMCGDELEPQYRNLVSYATDEVELTVDQRKAIMHALYNCRVLDPACGSGAFPMGVLQQMVHILKQVDPTNEMWNSMMIDIAIEDARKELQKVASGNESEKAKIEENRKARLEDIENAFNQSINDPDYARKLYLIEHCIYGVDIQPIATQISKLRFFISLVVDQKPTTDAVHNFGIRPLPNLEAKFVTANTLIPLDREKDLFTDTDEIRYYEELLHDINHRIFLAKKNSVKKELRELMTSTRAAMAQTMENMGAIGSHGYNQLMGWNMFDQNASAPFFDPEWMFGVKEGFDVVIGNPPYVVVPKDNIYTRFNFKTKDCYELYAFFFEKAITLLATSGVISFITASLYIKGIKFDSLRDYLESHTKLDTLNVVGDDVFENVQMPTAVLVATKEGGDWSFNNMIPGGNILGKMDSSGLVLNKISDIQRGFEIGKNQVNDSGDYSFLTGSNVRKYCHTSLSYISHATFLEFAKDDYYFTGERLMIRETGSSLTVLYEEDKLYCNRSLYSIKLKDKQFMTKYVLGILNSKAIQYYYTAKFKSDTELFPKIRIKQAKMLPIPLATCSIQETVSGIVCEIIDGINKKCDTGAFESEIDHIVYHLYNLTYDEVLIIDPETPITREEYENFTLENE